METVLVVAAHPDDEILGVGGTIARHAASGDHVEIVIMAQGAAARSADNVAPAKEIESLREAARHAAGILGAAPPRFFDFPDNRMDSSDFLDVVKSVEAVIAEVRPTIVYTHFAHDLNIDHRTTHQAVVTACRPMPGQALRALRTYETLSSTEWNTIATFEPNLFIDISETIDLKLKALNQYSGEMRPFPHPRSNEAVTALAQLRGSTAGYTAAEAFFVCWHRE